MEYYNLMDIVTAFTSNNPKMCFESCQMETKKMIGEIARLIEHGIAYQVDVPGIGSFVCLDYESIKQRMPFHVFTIETLNPLPVLYPCLDGYTRTAKMDFALWVPCVDGNKSPWGRGQPTSNLECMLMVL